MNSAVFVNSRVTTSKQDKPVVYLYAIMSTMSIQIQTKLNQLQQILPEGLPVDSTWLHDRGYSRQLLAKYVQHGWLVSPVRGVFFRKSAYIDQKRWESALLSMQNLLNIPFTVGGRSALELHGFTHFLSMSTPTEVHLYGNEMPPSWVARLRLDRRFVFHSALLFNTDSVERSKDFQQANFTDLKWGESDWTMRISTPERAILELLDELPNHESFTQVDVLMEGLSNLRPKFLNLLLADCRSVKTKRLFLWFAHRHNHSWLKLIETEKIDIGKGKRMLVPGGKLDPKYLITVPEELQNDRQHTI